MDDLPRNMLIEIIGRYGRDLSSDARRCESELGVQPARHFLRFQRTYNRLPFLSRSPTTT
jgi:hypothetical protein